MNQEIRMNRQNGETRRKPEVPNKKRSRKLPRSLEYGKVFFRAIVYKTPAEIADREKAGHNAR